MRAVTNIVARRAFGASAGSKWNLLRLLPWGREASADAEAAARDRREGLLHDRQTMRAVGARMLRVTRSRNQALSVLVLQLYDLPELQLVFGTGAAAQLVDEAVSSLLDIAGHEGFATRTGPNVFTLLMPGADAETVLDALHTKLGTPCCIEFELDGDEILSVPEVAVRTVGVAESVEDVCEAISRDIAKAREHEERRRKYLRRERESHTGAVRLQPKTAAEIKRQTYWPPLPATIPVPMGLH
jgi:GGDEF domain-containing protein